MRNSSFDSAPQGVSYQAVDGGAGGGGQAGAGQSGSQGGQQGAGGGQGAAGAGGTPVAYSDDMQITRDGKTMTMKDYIASNYVPKADYDNVRNLTKQQIEAGIRQLAKQLNISPEQARKMAGQPQPQPTDIFAGYRDLPLVDGANMGKALEGSLGPVAQAVAQMQQKIAQQDQMLKRLGSGVGVFAKDRATQERTGRISAALTGLGEGYDPKDPFLNELAQDILDAWDFQDKPEDFNKMLADRLSAAEKWVRAKDKKALESAKARRFVRPGGNATPSGAASPFKNQKFAAKEAADILFGQQSSRT